MKNAKEIVITGMGWEIPGWGSKPILDVLQEPIAYGEFSPQEILGKKGLRYKDRATLMALCAVTKALEDRGLLDVEPEKRANIGICVSSNLGNMDTICLESGIIAEEHVDKTSPMNLPVASSNVIPSSVAIRYGFKAINLMLCNGSTSGIDAVNIAAQMIRSGRADKMVVVGVEPINDITKKLMQECDPDSAGADALQYGEMAACLILEARDDDAPSKSYGTIGKYSFLSPGEKRDPGFDVPDVWFVPGQRVQRSKEFVKKMQSNGFAGLPQVDVTQNTGELYGALGVFQVLVASLYLKNLGGGSALVSNGLSFGDGMSSIQLNV